MKRALGTLVIICVAIGVAAFLSRIVRRDDGFEQEQVRQSAKSNVGDENDDETKLIKIRGRVVEGPIKGYDGGPNVVVQAIEGCLTQEYIRRPLRAELDFAADARFDIGATYEFEGYKRGKYEGDGPLIWPTVAGDSFGPAPTMPDHDPLPHEPGSQTAMRFFHAIFRRGSSDVHRSSEVHPSGLC